MATTRQDISKWFDDGVAKSATHLVVICDTFDHSDYPKYADSEEDARNIQSNPGSTERIMEVYLLSMDKETQLNQERAFNFNVCGCLFVPAPTDTPKGSA